jgi:putative phosphoesterase
LGHYIINKELLEYGQMDNKKLLVFSDTHGSVKLLKTVLSWAKDHTPPAGTICAAAFLGDGVSDLRPAADAAGFYCDWKLINGNNDFSYSLPETAVFDFGDYRFFMCHGHRHGLYGGYHSLIAAARASNADAALFGHAHVPFCKTIDGIFLLNPGSLGRPRSRIGSTFAVIECTHGRPLKAEFYGIGSRGEILQVKLPQTRLL